MSGWQGANVEDQISDGAAYQETIEAALHRLRSAYTTSMENVGAWHRAARGNADLSQLVELGWAARKSLEEKILGDPWILGPYASSYARYSNLSRDAGEAPPLRSDSHQAAVKQLAYLGLVNFGDLLLSGLGETSKDNRLLLDRGVVHGLKRLNSGESLWQIGTETNTKDSEGDEHMEGACEVAESEWRTLQLALVVYIDAVAVDASDPSLWLKLACAARRVNPEKYRPLIRYSLERAITVRPPHDPPMAVAARALQEFNEEALPILQCNDFEHPITEDCALQIPRYSWSAVGRALLRVGKQGSPNLKFTMSPFLILPASALNVVCSFLSNTGPLECTCRALSASVLAARTLRNVQRRKSDAVRQTLVETHTKPSPEPPSTEPPSTEPEPDRDDADHQNSSKRMSKRVQSQMITSGKRSQRLSRRSSVEFCLPAALFGCTRNDTKFQELLDDPIRLANEVCGTTGTTMKSDQARSNSTNASGNDSRLGPSSMQSFIKECPNNINPLTGMFRFVAHCSRHVVDVMQSDPGGSLVVGTCLLDCIDWMTQQTRLLEALQCLWSANPSKVPQGVGLSSQEIFSIDLLNCELRFKRCQNEEVASLTYDSDENFVSSSIAVLLRCNIEGDFKIRLLWLAALVNFWLATQYSDVSEARATEARGLAFLDDTIALLAASGETLRTPHLASPRRRGRHWHELSVDTLQCFKKEKQASAIVFIAQEKFLQATNGFFSQADGDLSEDTRLSLLGIGSSLLERYNVDLHADNAKYDELVDDFVNVFGKVMVSLIANRDSARKENTVSSIPQWMENLFHFRRITKKHQLSGISKSPSILTVLVSCLLVGNEAPFSALVQLFIRVVASASSAILNISPLLTEDDLSDDESILDTYSRPTSVKLRCLIELLPALFQRVSTLISFLDASEQEAISKSKDLAEMIRLCLDVLASVHYCRPEVSPIATDTLSDLRVLVSLGGDFFEYCKGERLSLQQYCVGVMCCIVAKKKALREYMEVRPKNRSERNKVTRSICDFVSQSCCDLALIVSSHPCELQDGSLHMSKLMINVTTTYPSLAPKLCDSLLWFWSVSCADEREEIEKQQKGRLGWGLDRFGKARIRIPVACAINATCGSLLGSFLWDHKHGAAKTVQLEDFYDSDASANDWLASKIGDHNSEELLRSLTQATYCIQLVLAAVDASDSVSFSHSNNYQTPSGPLLPLVSLRSLNKISLHLIKGFATGNLQQVIWDIHMYPVGVRSVGSIVDECLNIVYRFLHGFTLLISPDKEPASSSDLKGIEVYPPEDLFAAIMIYKVVMRVYSQGRKLPPRIAMDTITKALSETDESNTSSNTLRSFLFAPDKQNRVYDELLRVVKQHETWHPPIDLKEAQSAALSTDETILLRRGLARLIAQGPIPCFQTNDDTDNVVATTQTETELSTKFEAIIEVFCCGNQCDGEEWFKAGQCLLEKAEIVADRIGLSNGFMRSTDFLVPGKRERIRSLRLDALLQEQSKRSEEMLDSWVPHIGEDLSIFVRYAWSDFESLMRCSAEMKEKLGEKSDLSSIENKAIQIMCTSLFDCASWQRAWGGIFVSSLRIIAYRCFMLSLYSLKVTGNSDGQLLSEILESIGSFYYKQISGAQVYGFPMQPMLSRNRRILATASLTCFQKSAEIASKQHPTEPEIGWDLLFMSGKSNEKIAATFVAESFSHDERTKRKYEEYMEAALGYYAKACTSAIKAEKDGCLAVDQGGSSHGSAEAIYRLHATRLKCLIVTAKVNEEQRCSAENEALRLTELYWFNKPDNSEEGNLSNRDRLWRVLGDVVEVLSKLRSDNGFFHRSVFRHAQALLWAPVLYNPSVVRNSISLDSIPVDWVCKIRGLNHSTNSGQSALEVMKALFTKKRPQLVAAWFTNGDDTVIEHINASIRKYDSLRGKYIAAYVDCLSLCEKQAEIDTFLRHTSSTKSDLPSLFHGYAEIRSGRSHGISCDCLLPSKSISSKFFLVSVKRRTNNALASLLVKDVSKVKEKAINPQVSREKLKVAYSCFLRLRCDADIFAKWISNPYNRDPSTLAVANALTSTYYLFSNEEKGVQGDVLDWSGETQLANQLLYCLKKCAKLFPSLNPNYSFSKPKASSKQTKTKRAADSDLIFEVSIPTGLKAGESFVTKVTHGDVKKTVRLTVPSDPVTTIRFSLDTKKSNDDEVQEPPKKALKTG